MSEWNYKKLELVCDVRDGTHDSPKYHETGIPFITSKNLSPSGIDFTDISFISEENHKQFSQRSKVDKGDILFGMIGTVGNPVLVNFDLEFSIKNVALLKFGQSKELFNEFAIQVLKSNIILEQFRSKSDGGVQAFVSLTTIRNLDFPVPLISEQRQIATILSTADAVIEKTQAAIAKYKAIKQGMLQDLFTRGIDTTTGKLRPSYQDAPVLYKESKLGWIPREWEVDFLGNRVESYSGGTPSREREEYFKGEIPWISSSEVNQEEITFSKEHITQEALDNSSAKWVRKNSVLVAMYGATAGQISFLKIEATTNQAVLACLDSESIKSEFLFYLLCFNRSNILYKAQGSGQPNLSKQIIDNLEISIPDVTEQLEINKRLRTIDKKLQTEQDFLHKQQQIKAGLMNDLLSGKKKVLVENLEPIKQ